VPLGAPFKYLWLCCGRRAGKSFLMAIVACYMACFRDWRPKLSPGERAVILLVAADRDQAKILIRYIGGILEAPILRQLVFNTTADTVELRGNVVIEVATRNYRSVRGRSIAVALLDECCFWRTDDTANPDFAVYNAIIPSMATFGDDAMVIAGSSPYAKRGLLYNAWKHYFGKDNTENLIWVAPTREMNPTISQAFIDSEFERDPASAASEYLAEWRSDVQQFVDMDILLACTADGVFEIPPVSGASYVAFVDPSGGSSDAMTLSIAHRDKFGCGILDAIRECKPPFSPENVVEEFCNTLKQYHITKVTGDRYAGEWAREPFKKRGIAYELSEKPKSDIYRDMLPLLNSRKVQLLDDRRLISQLHGLERRTARGGRDSIDHGPGAHDDIANAVAGALVLAVAKRPMIISDAVLQWSQQPTATMQREFRSFEGRFN
jgi:Terminase large subunit, T4likevirus-type, N-terminal